MHKYTRYSYIDCTVIRCAQVDETKVASLLRLEYNMCNVDECEKELKRRQKFNELLIFYKSRKLHSKGTPLRLAATVSLIRLLLMSLRYTVLRVRQYTLSTTAAEADVYVSQLWNTGL